jgi:hypothetical protein
LLVNKVVQYKIVRFFYPFNGKDAVMISQADAQRLEGEGVVKRQCDSLLPEVKISVYFEAKQKNRPQSHPLFFILDSLKTHSLLLLCALYLFPPCASRIGREGKEKKEGKIGKRTSSSFVCTMGGMIAPLFHHSHG